MNRLVVVTAALILPALGACDSVAPLAMDLPIITTGKVSDAELVAAVLDDVHQGMQERRVYRVLAHVSRNYHDDEGRGYADIQEYLSRVFSLYKDLRITRVQPEIVVRGYEAKAIETFGTIAEPLDPDKAPPIQLQGQVAVFLEKIDNRWLIVEWGNVQ